MTSPGGKFNFASRRPLYSTCSRNACKGAPRATIRAAAPGVRATRADLCRDTKAKFLKSTQKLRIERLSMWLKELCQSAEMDSELVA